MTPNPNRFPADGFDVSRYIQEHGLDTADKIKRSLSNPITQPESIDFNPNIPLRIIAALQAASNEVLAIGNKAKAETEGGASFNATDAGIAVAAGAAAFIPVVGLGISGLISLIGGNVSADRKKKHFQDIIFDANNLIKYWQEQIVSLQQLAQQYPVKAATNNPNARTAGLSAIAGEAQSSNGLVLAGIAAVGLIAARRRKSKK